MECRRVEDKYTSHKRMQHIQQCCERNCLLRLVPAVDFGTTFISTAKCLESNLFYKIKRNITLKTNGYIILSVFYTYCYSESIT